MAVISSIANGNWSDGATWLGGAAPTATDDVIISAGTAVTLDVDFTSNAILTLAGTLTIASGIALRTGTVAGNLQGQFSFAGGTLNGEGTWYARFGSVSSSANSMWSYISGAVNLNYESTSALNGTVNWNLERVAISTTGTKLLQISVRGTGPTSAFTATNCTFTATSATDQITIGTRGGSVQTQDFVFTNCDFRGFYRVILTTASSGTDNGKLKKFEGCTFYGQPAANMELRFTATGNYQISNCVLANARLTLSQAYDISNTYIANDLAVSANTVYGVSNLSALVRESVLHLPDRASRNNHAVTAWNVHNCFIEGWGTGGPNAVLRPSSGEGKCTWIGNVLIGEGQAFANTIGLPTDLEITNNTVAQPGTQLMEMFMQETNPQNILSSPWKMRNNIQACTAAEPLDMGWALTAGAVATEVHIDSDYNARWNVTGELYRGYIVNDNAGTNNIEGQNPQFVDPARECLTWFRNTLANPEATYLDGWDYLLRNNGYDTSTQIQNPDLVTSEGPAEMFTWLMAGFVPQNAVYATAGEGGWYIGALPVSGEAVEEFSTALTVLEKYMPGGTAEDPDANSYPITIPAGWEYSGLELQGSYGEVIDTISGDWVYRLTRSFDHSGANVPGGTAVNADMAIITLTGADNARGRLTVNISITDDDIILNAPNTISAPVSGTGAWSVNFGVNTPGVVTWTDPLGIARQLDETATMTGWTVSVTTDGAINFARTGSGTEENYSGTIIITATNSEGITLSRSVYVRLRGTSPTPGGLEWVTMIWTP